MSRFEKKCFVGSAVLHGLLLVVFLFGAAFLPSSKPQKLPPVINFYDSKLVDQAIASGGNPNGNPEPPAPAPQPQKVEPPQPKPPEPPKKEEVKPKQEKTEQVKVEPRKEVKPIEKSKPEVSKKQPEKKQTETAATKPHINTTITRRTNDLAKLERERMEREARDRKEELARYNAERQRIAGQVGGIVRGVGKSISKTTVAEPLGPGGAAYANYASYVGEAYKRAVYAEHPQSDEDADAVIRVVIARDGSVRHSEWVRRTGNSVLNKAVDRAMGKVRTLPEFPPETKDSERSFNITIAFDAKRVSA